MDSITTFLHAVLVLNLTPSLSLYLFAISMYTVDYCLCFEYVLRFFKHDRVTKAIKVRLLEKADEFWDVSLSENNQIR